MADIIWEKVIELARGVFPWQTSDKRWKDAMILVVGAGLLGKGAKLDDQAIKDIDDAAKRFAEETQRMIAGSIKDSSKNDSWEWIDPVDKDDIFRLKGDNDSSIGKVTPPSDPDDVFRPAGSSNSSIGDVTPPSGPDDVFRPAGDKKDSTDKKGEEKKTEEKKAEEKKAEEEKKESEEDEVKDDGEDEKQNPTAVVMPAPDGEDDYTGVRRFMPGNNGPGEKDPFDVSDITRLLIKFAGSGDNKVDAWDRYDGLDGGIKFTGGDEPVPAWEKVGPKF